jgi:cytidine deaminase
MSIAASYESFSNMSDLPKVDIILLQSAMEALSLAYAPYSKFHVGAAVRVQDGHIVLGANQENASYPLCMCGERIALYNAAIGYPNQRIESCAIVAHNMQLKLEKPVSPCGACRQVLSEFEVRQSAPIRLILKGDGDEILVFQGIETLLPFSFNNSYLLPPD